MIRYLLIAAASVVALAGVGYAVRDRIVGAGPTRSEDVPAHPTTSATLDARPTLTTVLELTGTVERRSGDGWVAIRVGDVLDADDAIRTAADGGATVEVAGQQVTLHARTELRVGEISEKVNIVLTEGRLSAAGRDRTMRIEVLNSDAVAEACGAEFDVMSGGQGDLTVATTTGAVELRARGERVRVHAGEQSTVVKGAAPSVPSKIPPSLFLKVSAAGGGRRKSATLRGETTPGAVVSINGVRMHAAVEGVFELAVPLEEGKNTLVVRVEDVRGRVETARISRHVDTRRPRLQTEVEWR